MKFLAIWFYTCLIVLSGTFLFAQEKSVLFIGNSYTASNGTIPALLRDIALSLGDEIEVDSHTLGGYTFELHSTNQTTLAKIASQNWDFVVLQEQSQRPAFPPAQVEEEVFPYAKVLCDSIYSNQACTKPIFFLTWGHKNGDVNNCVHYPPICTYEGQQWRLRESYVQMAEDNNGWVAPCGMAFKYIRDNNPDIELYTPDNSHPSLFGSYLAACTFYSTIFHKSPIGASFPEGINESEANILQNAAWLVVTDSLDVWRIDTSKMLVEFMELHVTGSNYSYASFENNTQNADSCFWDFGNGSTTMQYPGYNYMYDIIHNYYSQEGEYQVCLTCYKLCESDKVCIDIDFVLTNIAEQKQESINIYPNPVSKNGTIYTLSYKNKKYEILSMEGKVIIEGTVSARGIDISGLSQGHYVLRIGTNQQKFIVLP